MGCDKQCGLELFQVQCVGEIESCENGSGEYGEIHGKRNENIKSLEPLFMRFNSSKEDWNEPSTFLFLKRRLGLEKVRLADAAPMEVVRTEAHLGPLFRSASRSEWTESWPFPPLE